VGRLPDNVADLVEHWTLLPEQMDLPAGRDGLAGDYARRVRQRELVREQFLAECRTRQVAPPTPKQTDRIVGTALA
jgi:hypothetical protein